MKKSTKKSILFAFCLLIGMVLIPNLSFALDYPHSDANAVSCLSCHTVHDALPAWANHVPQNADDTPYNNLCWSCHNDVTAPYQKTHSSLNTSTNHGSWTVECKECHNSHQQSQTKVWGSASYLYSGTSTSVTVNTIVRTGAGWTANAFANMLVIGNTGSASPVYYKIASNTTDTLNIDGAVDLATVTPGSTFAIVYGKNVREVLRTKNVKLFGPTGANSFADGDATIDGVCEVCHTQTTYHKNDGTGATHNPGAKCTSCHLHTVGFKASCTSCHDNPPVGPGTAGLAHSPATPTGSTTAGAHDTHVNGKGIICSNCHSGSVGGGSLHNDQKITISFSLFGGAYTTGSYDGQATANYEDGSGTPLPHSGAKTCSSVYCHGGTMAPNGGTNTTPAWDGIGTVTCGSCHGADSTNPPTLGSHAKHAGTAGGGKGLACSVCHNVAGVHINNEANFSFDTSVYNLTGASYNGTVTMGDAYGSCSTTYCHSNAVAAPTYQNPTWGNAASGACGTCHGTVAGTPPASAPHAKHVGTAANYLFSCSKCHDSVANATADSTTPTSIKNATLHADTFKNVQFDSFNPGGSYGATCTAVYCHSDGTTVATGLTPVSSQAWSGNTTCGSCHGGTGTGPTYDNGSPKANSHAKHTGAPHNYTCYECHAATVDAGGAIISTSNHVNKAYNVQGGTKSITYTYLADGGTCTVTACHGTGSIKWGTTITGCDGCHLALPTSGAHAAHVRTAATAYGSTSVSTTGGVYDLGCGNCHPKTESGNHRNGTVDIVLNDGVGGDLLKSLNAPTAGRTGTGDSTVCNLTYCHSNGVNTGSGITAGASPSWGNPYAGDRCAMCHGNSPSTGSHSGHVMAGIHYDDIFTGTTGLKPASTRADITGQSAELRPHGNAATATTINCNVCHSQTVTAGYNALNSQCSACHNTSGGAASGDAVAVIAAGSSSHLNGVVNVVLPDATTAYSKAQLRSAPAGWTRANGYKSASLASADSSLVNTADWATGDKTCTTACHLNKKSPTWGSAITCMSCHESL